MIAIKKILLLLVLTLGLTGCEFKISPDELIKSPRLFSEDEEINEMLRESLPKTAKIENIESEKGISAVKNIDVNQDEKAEILVFYSLEGENSLHMMVFESVKTAYEITMDVEIPGKAFKELLVKDITGDKKAEIIVNTLKNNNEHNMNIYAYDREKSKLFESEYIQYVIYDLNQNGEQDIVLFKGENQTLSADYYRYNQTSSQIEFVNEVVVEYFQKLRTPKLAKISTEKQGIVLSADYFLNGTEGFSTFFALNEASKLENLLEDMVHNGYKLSYLYSVGVLDSEDIDQDGITEIAETMYMTGKLKEIKPEKIRDYAKYTIWYKWDEREYLRPVSKLIYLDGKKTALRIPDNWKVDAIIGKTVQREDGRDFVFSTLNSKAEEINLLTILARDRNAKKPNDEYREFGLSGDYNYYYKLNQDLSGELRALKLGQNELEKLFKIAE